MKIAAMTALEKLKQAGSDLVDTQPFFGYLGLKLKLIEDWTCDTGWTDGVHIGYNPDFIDTLDLGETKTFKAHETVHCAGGDQWRRGTRDKDIWNDACDHVRNLMLKKAKFKPIKGWLCDERFTGMSVEQVFAILWDEANKKPDPEEDEDQDDADSDKPDEYEPDDTPPEDDGKDQPEDNGQPDQPDEGDPKQAPAKPDPQKPGDKGGDQPASGPGQPDPTAQPTPGTGQGEPSDEPGDEPGDPAANGNAKPAKAKRPPNPCGEVRDAPGTEPGEAKPLSEAEWALAAVRAQAAARAAGKTGAWMDEFVGELKNVDRDWRDELHKWAQMLACEDYSYLRPNRRYTMANIVMPSLRSEQFGKIVFVRDVSGSVSQMEDKACCSEVLAAIDQTDPLEAHIIQFDAPTDYNDPMTAIRDHIILEKGDDLPEMKRKGAGGTAFRPVFEYIEREEIEPVCMIFCTDLEPCDEWPEEPDYPVLWVCVNNNVAPWGDTIHLNDGGDWK